MVSFTITRDYYELVLQARKQILFNYECQEMECIMTREENPTQELEAISKKIKILNACYSTRVPNEEMTRNIAFQLQGKDLASTPIDIVSKIAHVNIHNRHHDYFSFATKYCALHEPERYPIFDNLVWCFFCYLQQKGFFADDLKKDFDNVNKQRSNAYSSYIKIYDAFIVRSGIQSFYDSYRKVDQFIWGLIKIALLCQEKGKEDLCNSIFKPIMIGIVSNAIWEIIKQMIAYL